MFKQHSMKLARQGRKDVNKEFGAALQSIGELTGFIANGGTDKVYHQSEVDAIKTEGARIVSIARQALRRTDRVHPVKRAFYEAFLTEAGMALHGLELEPITLEELETRLAA